MAKPKPKPPGAPPPPQPPPPPSAAEAKKGFMRRMFPFLLAVNVFVGAYVLVRTYYKDSPAKAADSAAANATASAAVESPEPVAAEAPAKPAPLPPIPEDEQRRLYTWMLEEKRKVKPRDAAEKKTLEDEKALLKHIIRADTLPVL